MKIGKPSRRHPPENTIPLINVVFLMLIFFLFAGSVAKDDARRIEPPENIAEDENVRSTGALIVTKTGELYQNDQRIDLDTYSRPSERSDAGDGDGDGNEGGKPADTVKLAADGSLPAAQLKKVLAKLTASGASKIVLITRKGK